ncbi:MAG TPA: hypothetical protein VGP99_09985, partial [Tepidisphaeraceae bacterium]|nr:hypothetical protein [Tepidisphaeraceae bacterium]
MRLFRRIALAVVLLIIIALAVVYFNLNRIVKHEIEVQSTDSLNLQTQLASARLSIFGGKFSMNDLQIASPAGFSSPRMLQLEKGAVEVSYGQLRSDPIHIKSLTLRKPVIAVEQANGKFNFQTVMDQIPKSDPNAKPVKLVIDHLKIEDATVVLRPGLPGLSQEMKVNVPTLEMHDVGSGEGNKNGAAIKDVAVLVISALAEKAGDMSNIDALKSQLTTAAKNVQQQAQAAINKQLQGVQEKLKGTGLEHVGKDLSGSLDKAIGGSSATE